MKKKNNKGITLIALIITIIILLILAGISISALTQTGIFEKAKEAKQKSENAQEEENKILNNYIAQIDSVNTISSNRDSSTTNKDLLWSGNYDTCVNSNAKQISGGCTLNGNYNIEDYSFILIIAATYADGAGGALVPNYYSTVFPVDIIKQNYGYPTIETTCYVSSNLSSRFDIGFINNKTFYIAWKSGLNTWNHQYISHIYGIK